MQKKLQQLKKILTEEPLILFCILFVALLPFYAGEIISNSHAYLLGKYINYLHVRISLHLILSFIISFLYYLKPENRKQLFFFLSIFIFGTIAAMSPIRAIVNQTGQVFLPLFLSSSFHLFEFLLKLTAVIVSTGILLDSTSEKKKILLTALSISIGLQFSLGLAQWLLKGPLFPNFLSWSGQPIRFTSDSIIGIFGYARVYGTTPHPNILAGIMSFYLFLLLSIQEKLLLRKILLTLVILIILSTLSKSALLVVFFISFIFLTKKYFTATTYNVSTLLYGVILALFLSLIGFYLVSLPNVSATFVESRSLIEKLYLEIIQMNPLVLLSGVGFTMAIPTLLTQSSTLTNSVIWGNQILAEPPHNVLLLSVLEFGLPMAIVLNYLIFSLAKTNLTKLETWQLMCIALLIAILGSLDHHLIY